MIKFYNLINSDYVFTDTNIINNFHNNSFDSINSNISIIYNKTHKKFLEIDTNSSNYSDYKYLSSSDNIDINIDIINKLEDMDKTFISNNRLFSIIKPDFQLYKVNPNNKEIKAGIRSNKQDKLRLIYNLESSKLLSSNIKNNKLYEKINIFKHISSKNNNDINIELYPNCLTCDSNSNYYTNRLNKDDIKNIYKPIDNASIILPNIRNFVNYDYIYINILYGKELVLKGLNTKNNIYDKRLSLSDNNIILSNVSNTNKVILLRYNNSILKLFLNV